MDKFKIHIISVHEHRLQYTCTICNCDLSSNKELFHHISIAHEGKKQPNAICIKPFRYSIYMIMWTVNSYHLTCAPVVYFAKPVKTKNQLISKCLTGVFNFLQKTSKNKSHSSKIEFPFFCFVFWRKCWLEKIILILSDTTHLISAPDQSGKKQIYHKIRKAKSLLS